MALALRGEFCYTKNIDTLSTGMTRQLKTGSGGLPVMRRAEWGAKPHEWVTVMPAKPDKPDTPAAGSAPAVTGIASSYHRISGPMPRGGMDLLSFFGKPGLLDEICKKERKRV